MARKKENMDREPLMAEENDAMEERMEMEENAAVEEGMEPAENVAAEMCMEPEENEVTNGEAGESGAFSDAEPDMLLENGEDGMEEAGQSMYAEGDGAWEASLRECAEEERSETSWPEETGDPEASDPTGYEDVSEEGQELTDMADETVETVENETGGVEENGSAESFLDSGMDAEETDVIPEMEAEHPEKPAPRRIRNGSGRRTAPVLTLEARGEVETEESREDVIWHEIHNAYRTRRMLTGQLGGIERTDTGKTITIVDYKGFRIVIPLKEMMINLGRSPSGQEYAELMQRQNKILGNMLGAEIDFIVKGIDSKTRSVVASRKEAMLKKRQIFYLDMDAEGMYRIHENRIVQARVIAVAEKAVRVEVFGVECSILARDLAWDWIGDAHERFSVGDQTLVRILSVRRDSLEEIGIKADVKSVSQNTSRDNLKRCRVQSKYAGRVTDVHKGVVYIRLSNGVNAVAHSCYDYRTPGKKDDVSFVVTKLDEERGVAVGIITRIIRQNL